MKTLLSILAFLLSPVVFGQAAFFGQNFTPASSTLPAWVQNGPNGCTSASASDTCTFGSNNTAGNSVVLGAFFKFGSSTACSAFTIRDNAATSNTYTMVSTVANSSNECLAIYSAKIVNGGGTKLSVTVTGPAGTTQAAISMAEFSGLGPANDASNASNSLQSSANPMVSSAITTRSGDDLVVACFANDAGDITSAISPFTLMSYQNTGSYSLGCEYNIFSSSQSGLTASMNLSTNSGYYEVIAGIY